MSRVDTKTILRDLGRRCAELRLARGLSQEELAERMGVETRALQAIEAGHRNFTMRTLVALAAALQCERVAELLEPPQAELVSRRPRRKGAPNASESR